MEGVNSMYSHDIRPNNYSFDRLQRCIVCNHTMMSSSLKFYGVEVVYLLYCLHYFGGVLCVPEATTYGACRSLGDISRSGANDIGLGCTGCAY